MRGDGYDLGGDYGRVYDYICRHFIASLSPDLVFTKVTVTIQIGEFSFSATGKTDVKPGWTAVLGMGGVREEILPAFVEGEVVKVEAVVQKEGKTSPPDFLTESDLIGLMEKHGIGTDASIATHINNVIERNYVKVEQNRRMVPTKLGIVGPRGEVLAESRRRSSTGTSASTPSLCCPLCERRLRRMSPRLQSGRNPSSR